MINHTKIIVFDFKVLVKDKNGDDCILLNVYYPYLAFALDIEIGEMIRFINKFVNVSSNYQIPTLAKLSLSYQDKQIINDLSQTEIE